MIGTNSYPFESFIGNILFLGSSLVLFPFATIVWDDFINTMMNGYTITLPIVFMLIWKLIKIMILYFFAAFIAPIGVLYILFITRNKR